MKIVQKPTIVGLPQGREVKYAGKIDDENLFVIHCQQGTKYDYKINIGPADDLRKAEVYRIIELQDSEITIINTSSGKFIFHAKVGEASTFDDKPIEIFTDLCISGE